MDYGEVLKRAWQIIWKHKVLWIFGILASCGQGSGGGSSGGNPNVSMGNRGGDVPPGVEHFFQQFRYVPDWQIFVMVGVIILVILLLVVLAIFLGTIGRVGLVRGTQKVDEDETATLSFGGLFRESMHYFWRVFLLSLLVGVAIFILVMLMVFPLIAFTAITFGIGLICLIPLICLLIPVAWAVSVVIRQAMIAIVVEDLGVFDGLRRGWEVVKANPGPMIIMFLILDLLISFIGGLIIALPVLLIVIPAIVTFVAVGERQIWTTLVIAGVCFVIYLPFLIVLSGILRSYIESAWTLTFLRLTAGPLAGVSFAPLTPDVPLVPSAAEAPVEIPDASVPAETIRVDDDSPEATGDEPDSAAM